MRTHLNPDDVPPVKVGPGCWRRDVPAAGNVRAWFVDMEPGAVWPHVDEHGEFGEVVLVVSGEVFEDDVRYPAGAYIFHGPNSSHRPRTETGVRLFGFNVL